jgi:hypothetical protein
MLAYLRLITFALLTMTAVSGATVAPAMADSFSFGCSASP